MLLRKSQIVDDYSNLTEKLDKILGRLVNIRDPRIGISVLICSIENIKNTRELERLDNLSKDLKGMVSFRKEIIDEIDSFFKTLNSDELMNNEILMDDLSEVSNLYYVYKNRLIGIVHTLKTTHLY